ncbi:DNA-processing protein DprA [Psychrosphaera ytuae]|uniref:DNA-processing protein DprA n=1 Tax=Psychrosphaera ytuae TaxID=2820710 RepID=UPI001E5FAB8E|nr:DNA-processing protein DprA [Psychrosphaera ytuae]
MKTTLSEEQALKWLALLQCPKLGIASLTTYAQSLSSLLDLFKAEHLCHLSAEQQAFLVNYKLHSLPIYQQLIKEQIQLVTLECDHYPSNLKQTSRPPILLFVQGNLEVLNRPQIAFVGSRTPTAYGNQVTRHLVNELVEQGFVITSGLALGIDACAHLAAIESGQTIAVMGAGHHHIYPKRHQQLAQRILETGGALVSEFIPDEAPQKYHFPRRNRVVSGMSLGTVVVEAAAKSGSLITARHALEEGRDVFAVPGNIFNAVSAGCHSLIRDGAKLVSCTADILEEYELLIKNSSQNVKKELAGSVLLASVDHDTTPVDVISERSNLPMDKVLIALLDLEIQGMIIAVPGGYCRVATHSNNK